MIRQRIGLGALDPQALFFPLNTRLWAAPILCRARAVWWRLTIPTKLSLLGGLQGLRDLCTHSQFLPAVSWMALNRNSIVKVQLLKGMKITQIVGFASMLSGSDRNQQPTNVGAKMMKERERVIVNIQVFYGLLKCSYPSTFWFLSQGKATPVI